MPLPPIPSHDGPMSAKWTVDVPHSTNMYFRPMLLGHGWMAKLTNALLARFKDACVAEGLKSEYAIDAEEQVASVLERLSFDKGLPPIVKAEPQPAPRGKKKTTK